MNKKLIIFGIGEMARYAHYYFAHESSYEVIAFTVDQEYMDQTEFCNCQVFPFETITEKFSPDKFEMFIAIGYSHRNKIKAAKFAEAKAKGYTLASFIHPSTATPKDFKHGENCFFLENNSIQPFVSLGNNITVIGNIYIGHEAVIHDHVWIAPNTLVAGGTSIGARTFIGGNSIIREHISIGTGCLIGAGSIIMKNTDKNQVFIPEPTTPAPER